MVAFLEDASGGQRENFLKKVFSLDSLSKTFTGLRVHQRQGW